MPAPESTAGNTPRAFAETTPPIRGDLGGLGEWLLNASTKTNDTLARLETTVDGMRTQLDRMETKLDAVKVTVAGHEKWVHTLKVLLAGVGIVAGWIVVYVVGPWLLAQFAKK